MMKFRIVLLMMTISPGARLYSQMTNPFTLIGTINIDTGRVRLVPMGDWSYYANKTPFSDVQIRHGHFQITGSIANWSGFRILLTNTGNYVSDYFFVQPGVQQIYCQANSSRETPNIANTAMSEYFREFLKVNGNVPVDSAKEIIKAIGFKSYLLQYTLQKPNSFVALWQLVGQVKNGYEPVLDTILSKLSDEVKSSFTGKVLKQQLGRLRMTAIGAKFPTMDVLTVQGYQKRIPEVGIGVKYVFLDFWFSHCGPCLSEFSKLKQVFSDRSNGSFQMMAISTDQSKDIQSWKDAIIRNRLPWKQYLDLNGRMSAEYSIFQFPTNFLLDSSGVIIRKDLTPEQLNSFLMDSN